MRVRLLLLSCFVGAMSVCAQESGIVPTISFPRKSQPEQQVQAPTPPVSLKTASTSFVLTFEGVGNYSSVNDFYNGGTSSTGTSGTNYGVQFSSNALALVDSDAGGDGNFANEPTPSTIVFFLNGIPFMNYSNGFFTGLSFYYCSSANITVNVYDGLNGTGNLLGTASFPQNSIPPGPGDPSGDFANWSTASVPFVGTAKSVVFSGVANQCGFDNITFGSLDPNVQTCDNSITGMTLRTTTDPQGTWTPVKGDLTSGYNMECVAKAPWHFFDIAEMSVDIPLKPGVMNPFYLKGTYDLGFWSYWERKGVDAEVTEGWGKLMWDILNGDEPLFYLTLEAGNYRLIDAATYNGPYALKSDFHWPGNLPPAEFQFAGVVLGQDDEELCPVTIKLKLGDNEAPVIANCGDYFELPLVRTAVRTRYGIGIDYVATLSQAALTGLVTDNCGINAVDVSKTRFTRMDVGENLVYVWAEDNAGNTTECEVYVYVYMPGTTRRSGEIGSEQAATTVGAEELSLQLYPNPTTGKVNLYLSNLNNPEVSVKLFNATGGMVIDRKIITDGPVDLDLTGNVSGLYLLKVNADGKEFNESIILK